MKYELRYGRGTIELDLPPSIQPTVIRKPPMPVLSDPPRAVHDALVSPVGDASIEDFSKARSACIAICDITRPVPNNLFLRPLIDCLMAAGIARSDITILIATGLHRPNVDQELVELIGDRWVLDHVRIENHLARNDADHVTIGRTKTRGTLVRLDRRFVEADLRIATGLVEPHFMAGYSGGRKVIAPGLAHAETITTFHNARFMSDPATANCTLHCNPLHEEQLEIVSMIGGALAFNTVIDEERRLSFVNFGEIVASHAEAVNFVRPFCEIRVPQRFNTVVTCAAGYPLDKTYYQTIKGMVGAIDILAPGGDLIIASECSEGLGSPEFVAAQKRLVTVGPREFLESIRNKPFAAIDEWQTQMQLKPMSAGNIFLYSTGLDDASFSWTGVQRAESLEQAVLESIRQHSPSSVALIPEGPYVVPYCQPPVASTFA